MASTPSRSQLSLESTAGKMPETRCSPQKPRWNTTLTDAWSNGGTRCTGGALHPPSLTPTPLPEEEGGGTSDQWKQKRCRRDAGARSLSTVRVTNKERKLSHSTALGVPPLSLFPWGWRQSSPPMSSPGGTGSWAGAVNPHSPEAGGLEPLPRAFPHVR